MFSRLDQKKHRIDPEPSWDVTRYHLVMVMPGGGVAAFALADVQEVRELLRLGKDCGWQIQTFALPQNQLSMHEKEAFSVSPQKTHKSFTE